tara:strand:- start:50 stop:1093 length:1044 start_codon:yes stop_codon:yes gene_type:complete
MYGAVGGDMGKQAINNKQPIFEFSKKINDYVRRQKNADEKMMFQEMKLRNEIKNRPPLGSGSRVGTDVAGRNPMPQTKPPLSVVRGPRGNTNIDVPTQRQLPLENARNTGGVSDTERAMLEFMLPKNPRHRAREVEKVIWNKDRFPKQSDRIAKRRPANAEEVNMIKAQDPYYAIGSKNVPEALTKATTNRGRPYPGPTRSAKEGLESLIPLRKTGKQVEATWYQDPRTGELFQYHYGGGALARGFYKRGANAKDTPKYARKAQEEFNPNTIGARTSADEGIMNTSPGKSYMDELGDLRVLEQQTNRRNFLRESVGRDESLIRANEAPSKNFSKNLEELQRLEELLK